MPGYERWWDGGAWSTAVRAMNQASADQPSAAPASQSAGQPDVGQPTQPDVGQPTQPGLAQPGAPQSGAGWPPPAAAGPGGYPAYPGAPAAPMDPGYPGAKLSATPDGVPLASWGARFGAWLIDAVILGLLTVLFSVPFLRRLSDGFADWWEEAEPVLEAGGEAPNPFAEPEMVTALLAVVAISRLLTLAYEWLLVATLGGTLGMLTVGIRVRRGWGEPGKPGAGQALLRTVVFHLPSMITGLWYLVDCLWPLWDQRRQALHDKAAKTIVVVHRR